MSANLERFTGLAAVYDAFRPAPPAVLVKVLTLLAKCERARLVVDIGCGTGLSTRLGAEDKRLLGNVAKPWYWSYRVRVAVK